MDTSDEVLRAVLDAAPEALIFVGPDATIGFANRAFERMFEFGADEALGLSVDVVVRDAGRATNARGEECGSWLRYGDARRVGTDLNLRGVARDGREFPIAVDVSPLDTGKGPLLFVYIRDLTDVRRREEEMRAHQRELLHVNRFATLGELAAGLAHELNQPLTAIVSNAQAGGRFLAHDPPVLEELQGALAEIVEDGNRAGDVIQRLRTLLRKGDAVRTPFDLNDAIREVSALMHGDAVARDIELVLDLDPTLPPAVGDRTQLQQVMLSLMVNAFEACDGATAAHPSVEVSTWHEDGVKAAVADNGVGIDRADLALIFEPFNTSKPDRIGMGLSICRSIVEAHGGRIWAESNETRGATVTFSLPTDEG